jgi:hypothetical protein
MEWVRAGLPVDQPDLHFKVDGSLLLDVDLATRFMRGRAG